MNENKSKCPEEPAIKRSFGTLSAVLPKYDEIEAKSQNAPCCTQSSNKPRSRFSWRRLLSYLPSWFKGANPDSPVPGLEAAESSKPSPSIRICHAKACTPVEAGHHHTQHEIMEKRSLKNPSYERILSSINFDDVTSDPNSGCERCCKQMGSTVCGIHSSSTDSSSNKNSKPIQIGVAEVSSHKGTKTKTTCGCSTAPSQGTKTQTACACDAVPSQGPKTQTACACNAVPPQGPKTKTSCACDYDKTREVEKTPIAITSTPKNCKQCMGKHPSSNSTCRESLLEQAWAYLQSLISTHRSGCQRCNQRRSNDMNINSRTSTDSNTCKESLLEQAISYLRKIKSDHKNGCPRCQQRQSSCSSNETSYLQSMLEQAWLYLKKISSDTNACCQRCKQSGRRVCCKHSAVREQSSTRQSCCATKPQSILKYPSSSPCRCGSQVSSTQEYPKKQPCPTQNPRPSCPKVCEKKSPQPVQPIPHLCRSSEERTFDKNSCYIPYCKQNSHSRLALTGSHHKSCCLSQLALDPQKSACTGTNKKSFDSIDVTIPIDYDALCASFNKNSAQSIISREILEYHSSAKCGGPCDKSNSNNNQGIKQGISLTQEPNDHKFCTRPKECKHSKQSVDQSNLICNDRCTGACSQYRPPDEGNKPTDPSCLGGCAKCNKTYSAAPMYQEQRLVDAEYEAFLDEQYGTNNNEQYRTNAGEQYGTNSGEQYRTNTGEQYRTNTGEQYRTNTGEQYGTNTGEQYRTNTGEQYGTNNDEQYGKMANQLHDTDVSVCENGCTCVTCIEQFNSPDRCTTDKGPKADPHNYRFYY